MKKIASLLWATLCMAGMAACSSDGDLNVAADEVEEASTTGTITFSFATGSASASSANLATRADDDSEIQTTDEKKVASLYAVVFSDVDKDVSTSGETATVVDTDTYYGIYQIDDIDDDNVLADNTDYTLKLPYDGMYQIVFLANPSSDLLSSIEALTVGTSTVADFKAITVTDDPSDKPMLMTSTEFYGIVSEQDTDLDIIYLDRIMARIDIINLADGVVITSATLNNRAYQSILYNDGDDDTSYASWLEDKTYTFDPALVGNSTTDDYEAGVTDEDVAEDETLVANASKSTIYSYEQYAYKNVTIGEEAGATDLASVTLTYYLNGYSDTSYTHTVYFSMDVETTTTSTDEEGTETTTTSTDTEALCLERNHYYKILVTYTSVNQTLRFQLINIEDWTDDEEFVVSVSTVTSGIGTTDTDATDEDGK